MALPLFAPDPAVVIGLMAGTSADGVDAALCRIGSPTGPRQENRLDSPPGPREADRPAGRREPARAAGRRLEVELLAAETTPYPPEIRERVLEAATLRTPALAGLDFELGERLAAAALELCRGAGVPIERVDLIGSHGQTVWHDPRGAHGGPPATLQVGEPAVIAARTGRHVIADFRRLDVALGGEGAPLVPYVDFLLLSRDGEPRAVLNVGGIANVTWLPGTGEPEDVVAFDTGPGNMLLDGLVRRFALSSDGFDRDGRLALEGRPHGGLVEELLSDPFFARTPPRSTGRELFGEAFVERMAARASELGLSPRDLMATAVSLTARSAAGAILRFCGTPAELLLCGGGRRNRALREALWELLPGTALRDTDDEGVDGDAKEAIAFAVLAFLAARGAVNHLPHTTGASRQAVLGSLVIGGAPAPDASP